jgi:hypothetical protein
MCGHQYPPRVISAWDHGASSLADGSSIASTSDDGSHQGGRARGSCGKGNRGESRRHVVTQDQPTVRSGWGQQARGQVGVRRTHPAQRRRQRRRGETSPARVRTRDVGPPVSLPAGRGRDSGPRGPPQGLPVWESGASAGGSVMEPRGIARLSERLTRDIILTRTRADVRVVCAHAHLCGRGQHRRAWRGEPSQRRARACVPGGPGTRSTGGEPIGPGVGCRAVSCRPSRRARGARSVPGHPCAPARGAAVPWPSRA